MKRTAYRGLISCSASPISSGVSLRKKTHAPKVVAEIRPTCVQRLSAQAKSDCKSTHDVTCACRENLSSADSVVRTKTEPGGESGSAGEFRKISADLRQKQVSR